MASYVTRRLLFRSNTYFCLGLSRSLHLAVRGTNSTSYESSEDDEAEDEEREEEGLEEAELSLDEEEDEEK